MRRNYEERLKRLEERVGELEKKTRWKIRLSSYKKIITLKFKTRKDNLTALERLCNYDNLVGLPYLLPGTRMITIPSEAEKEFSDLSYVIEERKKRSAGGYDGEL